MNDTAFHHIILQHISEENIGSGVSIGDERRQGKVIAYCLFDILQELITSNDEEVVVLDAGSGQGRLHPHVSRTLEEFKKIKKARVVGMELVEEVAEAGNELGREIFVGDISNEEDWKKVIEKTGKIDLAYNVYMSYQLPSPEKSVKGSLENFYKTVYNSVTTGALLEVIIKNDDLSKMEKEKNTVIFNHVTNNDEYVERMEEKVIPREEGFSFLEVRQTLLDKEGKVIRPESSLYVPMVDDVKTAEELFEKIGFNVIDIRERNSFIPYNPKKSYAAWFLLSKKPVKSKFKAGSVVIEEKFSGK